MGKVYCWSSYLPLTARAREAYLLYLLRAGLSVELLQGSPGRPERYPWDHAYE